MCLLAPQLKLLYPANVRGAIFEERFLPHLIISPESCYSKLNSVQSPKQPLAVYEVRKSHVTKISCFTVLQKTDINRSPVQNLGMTLIQQEVLQ